MERRGAGGHNSFSVREGGKAERSKRTSPRMRQLRKSRPAVLVILTAVCILFLVLLARDIQMGTEIDANKARKEELTEQIESEEARTDDIEALREYYGSEEYIREIAGDRLGLVDENQIIFKPDDN